MIVNIKDLEKVIFILLSKLKEVKGNEIELKNDYYWEIVSDELFNPYEEPTNITLGQLTDDLERMKKLLDNNNPVVYDLKLISIIFKALSIENETAF